MIHTLDELKSYFSHYYPLPTVWKHKWKFLSQQYHLKSLISANTQSQTPLETSIFFFKHLAAVFLRRSLSFSIIKLQGKEGNPCIQPIWILYKTQGKSIIKKIHQINDTLTRKFYIESFIRPVFSHYIKGLQWKACIFTSGVMFSTIHDGSSRSRVQKRSIPTMLLINSLFLVPILIGQYVSFTSWQLHKLRQVNQSNPMFYS